MDDGSRSRGAVYLNTQRFERSAQLRQFRCKLPQVTP
ncbi:MAG: hypothetical protein HY775_06790 [Acidobacteria bacterium]|nr:hypothetical protein [Acidobacteriota bacterium]